jgi:exonuclease VII large subunit
VLLLARGGGATEDLSCFNSEIIKMPSSRSLLCLS